MTCPDTAPPTSVHPNLGNADVDLLHKKGSQTTGVSAAPPSCSASWRAAASFRGTTSWSEKLRWFSSSTRAEKTVGCPLRPSTESFELWSTPVPDGAKSCVTTLPSQGVSKTLSTKGWPNSFFAFPLDLVLGLGPGGHGLGTGLIK